MKTPRIGRLLVTGMVALFPILLGGQEATRVADNTATAITETTPAPVTAADTLKSAKASKFLSTAPKIVIQNFRPFDMRGINVYEAPKSDPAAYDGFKISWGAGFTQQFQGLDHSNQATPKMANGTNANELIRIGHGFNNAEANLYLNAQVAPGIRVSLTQYLSTRHHNDTWVKDGYFLIDGSPIENAMLENIMKVVTLRVGHFEINYGDAHFRRTDGGNAMYNPLVGNYIMDAFTTEIGAELYLRKNGWMAMGGMTAGEVRGTVTTPQSRAPSYLAKIGVDKQLTPDLRTRLTGSMYTTDKSANNTLYTGDRAGSRYFNVVENTTSTEAAQAWSGAVQPGFRSKVTAYQLNPFVKVKGLEFFGIVEHAKGGSATETTDRTWNQYAGELTFRFLPDERAYVSGRYNTAEGELTGIANKVSVDRFNVGGGWFVTPNVLAKVEYVKQDYNKFPSSDIRSGGQFKGFVIEGVVAF